MDDTLRILPEGVFLHLLFPVVRSDDCPLSWGWLSLAILARKWTREAVFLAGRGLLYRQRLIIRNLPQDFSATGNYQLLLLQWR
ncbi:MAG: hypothetical protein CMJ77_14080 [Planctomycetaceae bacterium]|nr:hypothetical protein [Planctomycetaceae bacterium]